MVGGANGYSCWFPFDYRITRNLDEADVVWWEGGCDVNPAIYGEKKGSHTYFSPQGSASEFSVWNVVKNRRVFKIGTCKGLQNLSCYNGAKMVQHSSHPSWHGVILEKEGKELECISLHHQQVILDEKLTGLKKDKDYELIAHTGKLSPFHLNGDDKDYKFDENYKEPEIVYFPKTMSWGVQSHPEMMPDNSDFVKYCQQSVGERVKKYLG